jgi:hypothetical protein
MSVTHRVGRLERDHFTEACRHFRPWFLAQLLSPDSERRDRAALLAAGAPAAGTPADILAWLDAQPRTPAELAVAAALDSAVALLMDHPDDHAGIRAALARLAPHIGRCAGDPPLTILTALRAVFLGVPGSA